MVTIKDVQQSISKELGELNAIIRDTLRSPNALMQQVVDNFLATNGKQIRPMLVILSGKFFGTVSDSVLRAGAAFELLHNASLIHDDVVDESRLRRGAATVNSLWDNHVAVLVGDFFTSGALYCAACCGDRRIIDTLARIGRDLSLGEIEQIDAARSHILSEESYFSIIRRKTASLFRGCVEVGGYASAAPQTQLEDLMDYAEAFGLCFQIKDDIFDYFDNPEFGKPTGNDLREGKVTLPLIYAFSKHDAPGRAEMLEILDKSVLSSDDISTLISFAKEQGGIEYAYKTMERLYAEAEKILDKYPDSDEKEAFRGLFRYVIERTI